MSSPHDRLAARAVAVAMATASLAVLVLTYRYAVTTSDGQKFDEAAMNSVYAGPHARLAVLDLLGVVSIGLVVIVMAVCVGLALARGQARWALGAVVVIGGANVTTQILKRVALDRPDLGLGVLNSLPSGHTTVVASATVAALLVAPPAVRPLFILGGAAATALTGASTVVAGWHRPADIVAALAVCLFWAAAASLFLSHRLIRVRATMLAALVGSTSGIVVLGVIGVRPTSGWAGFPEAALVLGLLTLIVSVFAASAGLLSFDGDVSRETLDSGQDDDGQDDDDSAVGVAGAPLAADRSGS